MLWDLLGFPTDPGMELMGLSWDRWGFESGCVSEGAGLVGLWGGLGISRIWTW